MNVARIIILSSFLISAFASSQGQQCPLDLGTKTLYQNQGTKIASIPSGFAPVFINHVGRHGARHLTKDVTASFAWELLIKAEKSNSLSEQGKRLKRFLFELDKLETGNVKSISLQGQAEQHDIAKRMYEQNGVVFQSLQGSIKVMITREIRTSQTADAFLSQLKNTTFSLSPYVTNDTLLRFYDLAPAYLQFEKEGKWVTEIKRLKLKLKYTAVCLEMANRVFTDNWERKLSDREAEIFASDIFGFLSVLPSLQQEIRKAGSYLKTDSLQQFFTCNEIAVLSKMNNAEDFLLKGPGTNSRGVQVAIAAPLLADFINATEDFLQNGKNAIELRFTHAEAIAPLAALLGLKQADISARNIADFDKVWNASAIIPLSANIQWILYKSGNSNNYLVKFLLNEKETAVAGLKTNRFPYYNWTDVREFYIKKLGVLNLHLKDNSYQYLVNLR